MYYLGVDIGGTTVKAGLADETGRILESRRTPTLADDLSGFVARLTELIESFQGSAAIKAIGLGVPGLLSSRTHTVEVSPNIPCINGVNLEDLVAQRIHLPIAIENDANAGAYGEFASGAGRGMRHMIYLSLGTGLGSGLIFDGKLYTGASGYAAEFGHTTSHPGGRLCACGRNGCVEAYVSGTAMVTTAREKGRPDLFTAEMIFAAASAGDPIAQAVFEETGRCLGLACANLMNFLNPDMIVIGGGVIASGAALLNPTIEEARRRAFHATFEACPIVPSRLGPDSGMIGAAMLARDRRKL